MILDLHREREGRNSIALRAGATMEEIIEVLELRVARGIHVCNLGAPGR